MAYQLIKRAALLVIVGLFYGCATSAPKPTQDSATVLFNTELEDSSPKLESRYFRASSGHQLHYVIGGEGPLLVFYHGFPSFWYMWKYQLREFIGSHRVLAVDALGSNLSDKPLDITAYSIEALAAQLIELIDHESNGRPVILVGHDWGGALAWATAQAYPEKLTKLVVFNAPPYNLFLELLASDPAQRAASQYVPRLQALATGPVPMDRRLAMWELASGNHLTRGTISKADSEAFKLALTRDGAIRAAATWYSANLPDFTTIRESDYWPSRNASTSVPSLLFWGNSDRTFVDTFIEKLPKYATGYLQVHRIPNVGHSPQLDKKAEVNTVLRRFISES